jgi:hypothetical protein
VEQPGTPFADPIKTLRAIAYRGLEHAIDHGEIRDNLKLAAVRVYDRSLTVADIRTLDNLLSGVVAHRRKMRGSSPRRPQRPRRPVPSPEVPMRRHTDTETLDLLAEITRRAADLPPVKPSQVPPDPPPITRRAAPKWAPPVADPPMDFKKRVAKRRREMLAEEQEKWRSSSPGKPSKPSESENEEPPLPLPSTPSP